MAIELWSEVYREGAGSPVVALHGFGASSFAWRDLVPTLSKNNELHLLDLKGYGRSPKPEDGHYSLFDQAELVIQYLRAHNLTGVTFVGLSMGAGVSLVVALKERALVSRLVLISPVAYKQHIQLTGRLVIAPVIGPLILHLLPASLIVYFGLKVSYHDISKITSEQVRTYASALRAPGGRYALRETAKDITPGKKQLHELELGYRTLQVPTLILLAEDDRLVPLPNIERLAREIPGATLRRLKETGHDAIEERPDLVAEQIDQFFATTAAVQPVVRGSGTTALSG
jgi:pimeloyl-ACP methyl ester carboxylesterase